MATDQALAGLRILELGDFIAAPYAAKLLADLGAEVVKVEPPGGDSSRRYGPFRGDVPDAEASGLFTYLNTNKRSVTLDITTEAGSAVLAKLAAQCDAVIENLEVDVLAAAGLTCERVRSWNEEAVLTSISTFGRAGPRASWRGDSLQACAGSTVAHRTGDPDRYPLGKPLEEADFLGGVHAAAATLMALFGAEDGLGGQHVDISTADILACTTSGTAVANALYGTRSAAMRGGHRANAFYPWTVLPVADGHMEFVTLQRRHWETFLAEFGPPAWAADPRYQDLTMVTALGHADALDADLVSAVGGKTKAELWEVARRLRVPFQPVHTVAELVDSEQLAERGYFAEVESGSGAAFRVPGAPYQLSETPWAIRGRAPRLGEHNAEVFAELGLDAAEAAAVAPGGVA